MVIDHSDSKKPAAAKMDYSFQLAARVLLYASSRRQDNTYHGLCYTSRCLVGCFLVGWMVGLLLIAPIISKVLTSTRTSSLLSLLFIAPIISKVLTSTRTSSLLSLSHLSS